MERLESLFVKIAVDIGAGEDFHRELGIGGQGGLHEGEELITVAGDGETVGALKAGGAIVGVAVEEPAVGQGGRGEAVQRLQLLAVQQPDIGLGVRLGDRQLEFGELRFIRAGGGGAQGEQRQAAEDQHGQQRQSGWEARVVDHMTVTHDERAMIADLPMGISPQSRPGRAGHSLLWVLACLALAWVQVSWAGYQLGVGNQAIQISFLQSLHDPGLFGRDVMVQTTRGQYPSLFFALCAPLLSVADLPTLYLVLHLLATAGVMITVVVLSRSITGKHWAGLVAMLLLLAGHHQSLAGESLYSAGLTHTWAVFPLCLLAMALFYRGRNGWAFALAGVTFNLHALEAGYVAWVMGFVCLWETGTGTFRTDDPWGGSNQRLPTPLSGTPLSGMRRLLGLGGVFVLGAAPTLGRMIGEAAAGGFDGTWLQLMHIRSADRSFPSTWWQAGVSDVPRLGAIVGLASLAMSFGMPALRRRKTLLAAAGIGVLFIIGYVFTEIWPTPLVIRAQLFRSSRLLMVLALILIAHGCVGGWQLVWCRPASMPRWRAWLEFASATVTAASLAIGPLMVLLPAALVLAAVSALTNARMAWYQALVSGIAILVCLAAWQSIHFLLPGVSREVTWRIVLECHAPSDWGWAMLAGIAAVLLWVLATHSLPRWGTSLAGVVGVVILACVTTALFPRLLHQASAEGAWADVQRWARDCTPTDALLLTPPQQGGFRVHSQRAIVGEWRDGTQLYFSAAFASPWWERMNALQPGMVVDLDGNSLLSRGRALGRLDDAEVMGLAKRYGADHVVLPSGDGRSLLKEYDNGSWAVYRTVIAPPETKSAAGPQAADEGFVQQTVVPNIEKNRKSDVRIQVLDASGRPVDGAGFRIEQTSSAFGFGCSLPFFKVPDVDVRGDYRPPAVTAAELAGMGGLFNYSVTPYSGQWRFIEPQEGKRDYTDLDQYVDWCEKHAVRVELKFLAGYQPAWLKGKTASERARLLMAHARDLVHRYGGRVDSWQVTDGEMGGDQAPELFAELRKLSPGIRLGIADDTRFWSVRAGVPRESDMLRGLERVRLLKKQGVHMDFFGVQGHRPFGLWADAREIYEVLDAFANEGVRIHVTEFGVPVGARIEGLLHDGRWTPELQAEYYARFLTICFSHPNVDVINLSGIGAKTGIDGEGLLDEKGQPTPAFAALKELILARWRTNVAGTLGLDGVVSFRGFHGGYELTVTPPSGKSCSLSMNIGPGMSNNYRFKLDAAGQKLTLWEGR